MYDPLDDIAQFRGRLSADVRRAQKSSPASGGRRARRLPNHVAGRGGVVSKPSSHSQRVVAKVSSVRLRPGCTKAAAQLRYLQRDGAGVDGEAAEVFGKEGSDVSDQAFLERSRGDQRQFRIILAPENGQALDLPQYTRQVVAKIEEDLGTQLDWLAVAHYNTDQPHAHIVVRGVDERGDDLFIRPEYICHGLRHRAQDIATEHLGPRTPEDIRRAAEREINARRLTTLDRQLLAMSDSPAFDESAAEVPRELRLPSARGLSGEAAERRNRQYRRLEALCALGLAERLEGHRWRLDPRLEEELGALARRGDIIRSMYAAERTDASAWSLDPVPQAGLIGRVVRRGLADEHTGEEFLIVDGADGRTHYVECARLREPERVRVAELIRIDPHASPRPSIERLDARSLPAQIRYEGPVWLDKQLVQGPLPCADRGFGRQLQDALEARRTHLRRCGMLEEDGSVPADLYRRTRAREFENLCGEWSARTDKELAQLRRDQPFEGLVRAQLELAGGQYTIIENDRQILALRTDKYLRDRLDERVRIDLREGKDGRLRPRVTSINPDQGIDR